MNRDAHAHTVDLDFRLPFQLLCQLSARAESLAAVANPFLAANVPPSA